MVLVDGSAVCRTRRFDEWRTAIRENFVALDLSPDRRSGHFAGSVRSATVAHLQLSTVRSTPQECVRTPSLALADAQEYLQVGVVTRGAGSLAQDGRRTMLLAGDFAVYETGRPFRWNFTADWELLVLTWPRATIDLSTAQSAAVTARGFDGRSGFSGIVGGMLRGLVAEPPGLTAAGAVRLADDVGELVATLAAERTAQAGPAPGSPARADLLDRIDAWILQHLGDPGLGPADVARAHHISTRQLHRLFGAHADTVSRRIHRLRLERCRRDLLDPRRAGDSITQIARRWGYADLPQFSRAFRAAYGLSPSAYRVRAV
jgi:AraC family transcriptional activator of tynA and feaB